MPLDPIQLIQGGGVLAFALLVLLQQRDHQRKSEAIQARQATAAEKQVDSGLEMARSITEFAHSMTSMASEVRDLAGEVREIRNDITPIQRPPMPDGRYRGENR